MWGRRKGKGSSSGGGGLSLLSLGSLARSGEPAAWAAGPAAHHQRGPLGGLSTCRAGGGGSVSCGTRGTELFDIVGVQEAQLAALTERVHAVEDTLDRLQADVVPALKAIAGSIRTQQQARQDGDAADGAAAAIGPGPDAAGTADTLPSWRAKASAGVAAAAGDSGSAAAAADQGAGRDQQQPQQQQPLLPPQEPAAPAGPAGAAPARGGLVWPEVQQSLGELDHAVGRALADLVSLGRGGERERDDCGSVRSFCTSISCGSTQVSGPALMTDLRPAAKAPSRAPAYVQQAAQLSGLWEPGLAAAAVAAGGAGGARGCHSWPLQLGLHEEASPEEIQALIDSLCSEQAQQQPGQQKQPQPQEQEQQQQEQEQQQDQGPGDAAAAADAERQRQAISCLALHAERDEEVRQLLCTPPLLRRVAGMLRGGCGGDAGGDLGCCQAAAHLVWYVSRSSALRHHLQEQPDLLPALLALLGVQDTAAARAAAFALNNLAHEPACRRAMVEAGGVGALIDMLSGCDALGQEAAAAALMMLASEEASIRALIVACNGCRALVAVMRYGGPAAQEAAASALENLSLDSACEAALASEGAVEGLLQVLADGTTGAQAAAAGALRNLAVNEELEGHLLACGTVDVLVRLVSSAKEDVGVRTAALEGLRNLAASSTRAADALIAAGGAAMLVDAARSLPAAARAAALGALLVLSMEDSHRRAVMSAGAGGPLVHAALSGSPLAKELAARALANLAASSEQHRSELLREGAATVLAALLKGQLAGLGAQARQAPDAPAAPEPAASLGCCLAAARALQNLSKSRVSCRALLDAGAVAPLARALAVPGLLASAAASALCGLCRSGRALRELADAGGCATLVSAVARPKHLTPRGQRQGLRLLRRLVKGPAGAKAAVQQEVASLGLQLV